MVSVIDAVSFMLGAVCAKYHYSKLYYDDHRYDDCLLC